MSLTDIGDRPRMLCILGPHGSGKTTLRSGLQRTYPGLPVFNVKLYFRQQRALQTALGRAASGVAEGHWYPDQLVKRAFAQWLSEENPVADCILESFPGNEVQARDLSEQLRVREFGVGVVYLEVPATVCARRARARRVCAQCGANRSVGVQNTVLTACDDCGGVDFEPRSDDAETEFETRSVAHNSGLLRVVDFYRDAAASVLVVDGTASPTEVLRQVVEWFGNRRQEACQ